MAGYTLLSDDGATNDYAACAAGANLTASDDSGGAAIGFFGQGYNGPNNFGAGLALLEFDTSAIVDVPGSVTLRIVLIDAEADPAVSSSFNSCTFRVAAYDFGATVETGDWLDTAALNALTVAGSQSSVGVVADVPVDITLDPSVIVLGGTTRLILYSDHQASGTSPATAGTASRYETWQIYGTSDPTPANRPTLTLTEATATTADRPTLSLICDIGNLTPYGEEPGFSIMRGTTSPAQIAFATTPRFALRFG